MGVCVRVRVSVRARVCVRVWKSDENTELRCTKTFTLMGTGAEINKQTNKQRHRQ